MSAPSNRATDDKAFRQYSSRFEKRSISRLSVAISAGLAVMCSPLASVAQEQPAAPPPSVDNGTNPTVLRRSATLSYEHLDVSNDFTLHTAEFSFTQPINARTSFGFTVPYVEGDLNATAESGVGDISVKATHIAALTRRYGIVVQGEALFDTADSAVTGNGQTVLKATLIYARFLSDGSIFAPAIVQSLGVDPPDGRPRVNTMTMDFYYVPRLSNPAYFITVDPAIVFDFEEDRQSAALAVTAGRIIGPAFGGTMQAYLKPSILIGQERPADWSIEAGIKLIGF